MAKQFDRILSDLDPTVGNTTTVTLRRRSGSDSIPVSSTNPLQVKITDANAPPGVNYFQGPLKGMDSTASTYTADVKCFGFADIQSDEPSTPRRNDNVTISIGGDPLDTLSFAQDVNYVFPTR